MYDNASKNTRNAIERTREAGRKTRDFGKKAKKSWDDDAGRRREILYSVNKNYAQTLQKIRDPETRRQAQDLIGKGPEMRRKLKEAKSRGATNGINALADLPIGGTSFGSIIKEKLANKFPALDAAGLLDREAALAMTLGDKGFFLKEVDFIEKDGQRMSVFRAINEATPFNSDETIKYLNIAGAAEGIYSTDDVDGAIGSLINAMDAFE